MSNEYEKNGFEAVRVEAGSASQNGAGNGMIYNDESSHLSSPYVDAPSSSEVNGEMNSHYVNSGANGQHVNSGMIGQHVSAGANGQYINAGANSQHMNSGMNAQHMNSGVNGQHMNSGMNGQHINNGMNGQHMNGGAGSHHVNGGSDNRKVNNGTKKAKAKKKDSFGRKIGRTAVIAATFGLVAGGIFQGIDIGVDKLRGIKDSGYSKEESTESADNASSDSTVDTQKVGKSSGTKTVSYDVADIVAKAQPSIVSITTKSKQTYQYFFQDYEQDVSGAGSGIIIGQVDDTLYVATNFHVIKDANELNVGFNDGEIVGATVKGYDEDADIAVVAVKKADMKDSTIKSITIANVGDSSKLQVGEPAIAIGNALGYGQSVTVGYISALNRTIEDSDGLFIQTDAAINPGNSGGALINSEGQVIGINSVKYVDSQVEGMGFSIPINSAMEIINSIIEGKQTGNVHLGISGVPISAEYSQIYGFPEGIYVKEVEAGSPAENSELHTGDIIVEIDGKEVYTVEDVQKMLKQYSSGDEAVLTVYRADTMGDYDKVEITVKLESE